MKRIATLIAASVMAASSHSAIITTNVTGVLGDWYTKIFSQPVVYQTFLVGNPDFIVSGSISYDTITEDIVGLSLFQVGSVSAIVNNGVGDTTMTISDLSWSLSGSVIDQTGGTASCAGASIACSAVAASINGLAGNSPFEYDGVALGFRVGGVKQLNKPGYLLTIDAPFNLFIDVAADQAYIDDPTYNASHNALFQLTAVPVPAAAWLMGSGLVGLAAMARRRPI
jgi:hypothetical protein